MLKYEKAINLEAPTDEECREPAIKILADVSKTIGKKLLVLLSFRTNCCGISSLPALLRIVELSFHTMDAKFSEMDFHHFFHHFRSYIKGELDPRIYQEPKKWVSLVSITKRRTIL